MQNLNSQISNKSNIAVYVVLSVMTLGCIAMCAYFCRKFFHKTSAKYMQDNTLATNLLDFSSRATSQRVITDSNIWRNITVHPLSLQAAAQRRDNNGCDASLAKLNQEIAAMPVTSYAPLAGNSNIPKLTS